MYRKNVASQYVYFCLVNATTGAALTGATVTARRSIDNAAQAAATGTITEDGNGQYHLLASQADMNGNNIGFLFTATNAIPVSINVVTTACDPTAAATFGITNIDAAITSRMATYTQPTGFLAATFPATVASTTNITAATGIVLSGVTHTGAVIPTVTTVTNQLTAAQIATGVWQDATAGDFTVASSIGKSLYTTGNAPGAASGLALVGSNMGTVSSVTGSVGSVTGAVGSVTGNVGGNVVGSVASVTGNVGGSVASVTAGVTVTTNNDKTGYALTSAEENAIADALLARNVSGGSSAGRTVKQALHVLRNKTSISGGTLTVYDTDDTTSSFTATVTTTAGDPISQIDPA